MSHLHERSRRAGRQFSREFAASIRSLKKFGAPLQSDGITPATFTQERTDLSDRHSTGSDRHSHAGIEFPAAWKDRVAGTFFGVSVHFISLDHLIANKQARGRSTDLEQLKHISKTQTRKKPGLRKSECEVPPQITPDNQQSLKSCALWPAQTPARLCTHANDVRCRDSCAFRICCLSVRSLPYCRCMPWETRGLRARRVVISGLLDHRVLSVPDGHLVHVGLRCQRVRGVPLGMRRIRPEYLDAHPSDRSVAADVLVREEPDEEED